MARKLPANNRSWPKNLSFDFGMPALSPAATEAFIDSLPTNDRNKQFLLLRYREGKTYNEIAQKYGLTATGVHLALKRMWEKYGGSPVTLALPTAPSFEFH